METASTSGLIPECCPVGEEGPHWCLPARFYSSTSISMWASHCPPLLLLAFHHPSLPPSPLPSSTSPTRMCVCVCFWMFQEPSWLCRLWEERKEEKEGKELRELEPWLQSSMTQSGSIHAPGENIQTGTKTYCPSSSSSLCNQRVQIPTFPL